MKTTFYNSFSYSRYSKAVAILSAVLFLPAICSGCSFDIPFISSPSSEITTTTSFVPETSITESTSQTEPTEETVISMTDEEIYNLFIERIAGDLLEREITPLEFDFIAQELVNGETTITGAIMQIINGDEFSSLEISSEEFANRINVALLNMSLTTTEIDFIVTELEAGITKAHIIDNLANRLEFIEFCAMYGITTEYSGEAVSIDCLYENIDSIPETDEATLISFGGYTPSDDVLQALYDTFAEFEPHYYKYGFILIDVNTGRGISYNVDREFYSASSIKGPYAISLAALNEEAAIDYENTIINMLVNSDNDAYTTLQNRFRREYIMSWCEEAGVDPNVCVWKYPQITPRDMTRLWIRSYDYLTTEDFGETVGSWLNHPVYSLINSELGELYETYSKAGWMSTDDPRHTTTIDAGIVFATNGPYIVVIESTVPSTIEPLRPLMQALELAHNEMTGVQ